MPHRSRRSFLQLALLCAVPACVWVSPEAAAKTAPERQQALAKFMSRKKFVPEADYTGADNETDRLRYEVVVNDLARALSELPPASQTKPIVLGMFKPAMAKFESADTEDQDRFLEYLEELMDIFDIESSDGQLNQWRYGFDPKAGIDAMNADALAAMTPDERGLLACFKDMTSDNADEVLRSVLGRPVSDSAASRIWFLRPDASSAIGLTTQGPTRLFIWTVKNRFTYTRKL